MRTRKEQRLRGAIISIVSGIAVCGNATAQEVDTQSLNVDMSQCVELGSEAERVACYQQRVAAALAARESGAATPSSSPAPAAAPAEPEPRAAVNTAGRAEPRYSSQQNLEQEEIVGTISSLRETLPDRWVITLDNGQVWQMNQSKKYPLRVGLDVRVYPTRWGPSYRLTAPDHGGYVQVRRAR